MARRAGWGNDQSKLSEGRAVDALLDAGAIVDALGEQGEKALLRAAGARRFDFFECLVKAGAHVDHKDNSGAGWQQWASMGKSARKHFGDGMAGPEAFMAQAEGLILAMDCGAEGLNTPRMGKRL